MGNKKEIRNKKQKWMKKKVRKGSGGMRESEKKKERKEMKEWKKKNENGYQWKSI